MNRNAAATVSLVVQLREVRTLVEERGPIGEGGDVTGLLETYNRMIADGERYEDDWREITHNGADFPPSQALAFKREWSEWGERATSMNAIASLPAEELVAAIRLSQEQSQE
jgi:hypothetical protein